MKGGSIAKTDSQLMYTIDNNKVSLQKQKKDLLTARERNRFLEGVIAAHEREIGRLESSGRFLEEKLVQQNRKICSDRHDVKNIFGPASPAEMPGPNLPRRNRAVSKENYATYLEYLDREQKQVARKHLFSCYRDKPIVPQEHGTQASGTSNNDILDAGWQIFLVWNKAISGDDGRPRPHWLERHGPFCSQCGSSAQGRYAQPWLYIELETNWTYYLP